MWLIIAESDILSDHADGLGTDIQERGNILKIEVMNNAGTTSQQLLITLMGRGAVEVDITRTELEENVLGNDAAQLHLFSVLTEKVHQLLPRNPEHAAGHHRLDCSLRRTPVEERRIVGHEFAGKREPRDVFPVVAAMIHILKATIRHKGKPPRRVTLALQLVALAVSDRLALLHAKLAQRLDVNAIFPEFLFYKLKA